ncbi:MAG: class I tRNA ligase family protein, partial [Bacillota bacterium]|nr:class I tRNA ligase family protein [Bacillota bacterium]
CVVDMSAFYLDIIKDRLYVSAKDDQGRKAAQTVLYETLQALVRLLMPILSVTTEEIWSYIRKEGEPESVQLLEAPKISDNYYNEALAEKWAKVIALRDDVSKALEEARRDKVIGHSLDAAVSLTLDSETYEVMQSLEKDLADIFIVSAASISKGDALAIDVKAAPGEKCERCWKYSEDLNEEGLCPRCAAVVKDME